MVIKGRPKFSLVRSYLVSDGTRAKLREVDFGWGQAAYSAPAKGNVASFQISHRNKKGEDGILVTLCLPALAMERFVNELDKLLMEEHATRGDIRARMSSL
uniref:Uncharacterized protein n=1 Tax=Rhizophora mucronata TaxID=61149 RepID=A0A2P2IMJ4_RHIMU